MEIEVVVLEYVEVEEAAQEVEVGEYVDAILAVDMEVKVEFREGMEDYEEM